MPSRNLFFINNCFFSFTTNTSLYKADSLQHGTDPKKNEVGLMEVMPKFEQTFGITKVAEGNSYLPF